MTKIIDADFSPALSGSIEGRLKAERGRDARQIGEPRKPNPHFGFALVCLLPLASMVLLGLFAIGLVAWRLGQGHDYVFALCSTTAMTALGAIALWNNLHAAYWNSDWRHMKGILHRYR